MPRVPVPLSGQYQSTRLSADEQRIVNMYPHSGGGYRQFPGVTQSTQVLPLINNSNSLDINANQSTPPAGGVLKPDGSEFYVMDSQSIDQYTLSTPGDISTGSYAGTFDTGVSPVSLLGFKSDGTLVYYVEDTNTGTNVVVYEKTLGTPWDITSATGTAVSVTIAVDQSVKGGGVHASGTKIYISGGVARKIFQYSMAAWDLSSINTTAEAEYDVVAGFYSGTGNEPIPHSVRFNSDGSEALICLFSTNTVGRVQLGTAYDFGGEITEAGEVDPDIDTSAVLVAEYVDDDTILLAANEATKTIREFDIEDPTDRGALVMDDDAYFVMGTSLYKVQPSGVSVNLGAIAGTQRAILDTDGTRLVITVGSNKYKLQSTNLVEITDGDLGNADTNAYLDSRFYFDQTAGQFIASAIDDPTTIDSLDTATAESFNDDIVRVLAVDQFLYLFGERSIEIWYTSGVGRPPVDRQEVIDEVGLIGRYAVAVIDNVIYWIDDQRRLARMKALQFEIIYVPALGSEWSTYSTVSDAIMNAYTIEQENFVEINLPTEDVSWTWAGGGMSKREDTSNSRFNVTSYIEAFNKLLGVDKSTGQLFEFDRDTYQDDGSNITRTLDTALITSELYEQVGREMLLDAFMPTIECSGSGTMTVSVSKDGGAFGASRTITLKSGTHRYEAGLTRWGKCREAIFRMTTTSNISWSPISAALNARLLSD